MKANFISVWDGGYEVVTQCQYDEKTGVISNIETTDAGDVDCLDGEFLELPNGDRLAVEEDDDGNYFCEAVK